MLSGMSPKPAAKTTVHVLPGVMDLFRARFKESKKLKTIWTAAARGELKVGMTVRQVEGIYGKGLLRAQSAEQTTMEFTGNSNPHDRSYPIYHCFFRDGKLESWVKTTGTLPPLRMTR